MQNHCHIIAEVSDSSSLPPIMSALKCSATEISFVKIIDVTYEKVTGLNRS